METFNLDTLLILLSRFSLNLAITFLLVRLIYERRNHNRSYVFNYLAMAVIAFLVCYFLSGVDLGIGVGLGLFAIFAIFRYRTNKIPVREMGYLFLIVGLSVINSLVNIHMYYVILVNVLVLIFTFLFEISSRNKSRKGKHLKSCYVVYRKLKNIDPSRKEELYKDLEDVTGLKIQKVNIHRIEIEKEKVHLKIFY